MLCRVSKTLGKACKTLDECFIRCHTRQKKLGNFTSQQLLCLVFFYRALGKDFTECHQVLGKEKSPSRGLVRATEPLPSVLGDTRQIVFLFAECPPDKHSATRSPTGPFVSTFAECTRRRHSAKVASLPSAEAIALGKEALPVSRYTVFAECYDLDTRQSTSLPSVTLDKVTNIPLF
jgi:hypothetical protein